jgi:hypothetical protein
VLCMEDTGMGEPLSRALRSGYLLRQTAIHKGSNHSQSRCPDTDGHRGLRTPCEGTYAQVAREAFYLRAN